VMNVAFGDSTIAVDTHVFRVANRTRLAPGRDPAEVEARLVKFTPDEFRLHAHHWLILHGRYVCVARVPKCPQCVIVDLCEYTAKTKALADASPLQSLPLKPPLRERAGRTATKLPAARRAKG
jgi:endonuclease III